MTPQQIAKARKIILGRRYRMKRYFRMKQMERWWTEQFYMYGHSEHVLYDPKTSWRECQRFRKKANYYRYKK